MLWMACDAKVPLRSSLALRQRWHGASERHTLISCALLVLWLDSTAICAQRARAGSLKAFSTPQTLWDSLRAAAHHAIHEASHRERGRTPPLLSAENWIRTGLYHKVFWIQMMEKPLLDLLKWNEKATSTRHNNPFQRHKSNYTLPNKLPHNISTYTTFWSGDVKICCTASMGGLQKALSFTHNIHLLNLHKGLVMWQQKTFQSQHKTPVPSMTALQMHMSTGLIWKIKVLFNGVLILHQGNLTQTGLPYMPRCSQQTHLKEGMRDSFPNQDPPNVYLCLPGVEINMIDSSVGCTCMCIQPCDGKQISYVTCSS